MKFADNIVFVSSRYESGSGLYLPQNNIIITTDTVVFNLPQVVVKHPQTGKIAGKVLFTDSIFNLAFISIEGHIIADYVSFRERPPAENEYVRILSVNYFNKLIQKNAKISSFEKINNYFYPKLSPVLSAQTNGGLVFDVADELIGLSLQTNKGENQYIIPAGIITKAIDDYLSTGGVSLRCPVCGKVVRKENVKNNICPNCKVKISDFVLGKRLPEKLPVAQIVEKIIVDLNNDLSLATLNENFWELRKGSASIFIRYNSETQFVAAFSILGELKEKNRKEVLDFLISENKNMEFLSFAINKNMIFLVSDYIFEEDFSEELGKEIFSRLEEKADFYDDIINKILEK